MNKKLLKVLQDKCKDFGLTDNAIEDLAKAGSEGLTDESSEEDIAKKADSLVPFAKLMQGEVTRKSQKQKPSVQQQQQQQEGNEAGGGDTPDWFKAYKAEQEKRLQTLEDENNQLKAEKTKSERSALIASKAKELNIPDSLMKRFSIGDEEDVDKVLAEYKQDLVTSKLMPADTADIISSSDQAAKDDAKVWANSLPNL